MPPFHAASGVGYGTSRVAQQHRHVPEGWLRAAKYFLEELGVDVNVRDADGFTALHHAAARGNNETIQYLVSRGADVMAVNRAGQTTVDMANSPEQRTQPFPETIALLESGREEQQQLPRLQVGGAGRAQWLEGRRCGLKRGVSLRARGWISLAISPVQPVWCDAPTPRPVSPWKYSWNST